MARTIRCKPLLFATLGLGFAVPALFAQTPPPTGLGQTRPHAPDVSTSPDWHVYVFQRDGIRYLQVNDASGTVRGAIATANGSILVLPIGKDAANIHVMRVTTANAATGTATAMVQTVYQDTALSVVVSVFDPTAPIEIIQNDMCQDPGECGHFANP